MPTSPILSAALWMSAALLCFTLMAVAGREAGQSIPTAELLTWRSVIGFVIVAVIMLVTRKTEALRTPRLRMHLVRNILHFAGQYGWYSAVMMIPLAQLFALEFTAPIWVALLAPFLLGESLGWRRVCAIMISFLGVLLVIDILGVTGQTSFGAGQIWALLAAIFFAGNMIATKRLMSTDSALTVIFFMTVMQIPLGVLAAGGLPELPSSAVIWGWVIILSVASLAAHFCLASAFAVADASIVAPMDFFRLPLIAVVGTSFYAEPMLMTVLAGGALIFLGNYLNMRMSRTTL